MEQPTPCVLCNDIFDLYDGKRGLTHETSDITICASCHEKQDIELERVNSIRNALERKEELNEAIKDTTENIRQLKFEIEEYEADLSDQRSILIEYEYYGEKDEYHDKLEQYF